MSNGQEGKENTIWLIVFCDITTNLMLFFLMLFAMTRMSTEDKQLAEEGVKNVLSTKADRQKAVDRRHEKTLKEQGAIEKMKDGIASKTLPGNVEMQVTDKAIKIILKLPAFFATGSPELQTEAKSALDMLVEPLMEFPNDIIIEGHTDNVPILGGKFKSNWELSIARAVSVIDFLVSRGLNSAQFVAGGYGEYHPAHPNDTAEHKAQNRRIEITIVRQSKA